jgi:AraC-like DNA-binding protein
MRFDKFIPTDKLKPFIHYFAISENTDEHTYKVLPSSGLVIGFQYKGQLSAVTNNKENALARSGITGLQDTFRIFKNISNTGTILVYFTETGIAHFTTCPPNEFFNQSISLDNLFNKALVAQTEEKLANAVTDLQRIRIIEQFLLWQWKERQDDKLVIEAVKLIYQSKGAIKIKELHEKLFITQSPLEKRFRKIVGTSPKKFASIVRFNAVLKTLGREKSLTDIAYENNFFDQSHFIKDFKQYTGDTPENFKRFLS